MYAIRSYYDGDLVGYYYKEAFVRQQTSRGLRCDLHESYNCEHVQHILGIDQEDMVQNAADGDDCEEGDIQMFKPVDEAMSVVERYIHDHPKAVSVPFPYSNDLRDQVRRIDMVGLESWVSPAGQQYDPIDRLCPQLRITSYNVCYTKLLRPIYGMRQPTLRLGQSSA